MKMDDVEISDREKVFDGFLKVFKYTFHHSLYKGGVSKSINREVLERGHSAAVLLYDPELDKVALIEQFRIGALVSGKGNPWIKELIAGMIDGFETPESAIIRETAEEAGVKISASDLKLIGRVLLSPGGCSETCTIFCAIVDLSNVGGFFGNKHEGEDIKLSTHAVSDVVAMVQRGEIQSATAVLAIQWLVLSKLRDGLSYLGFYTDTMKKDII